MPVLQTGQILCIGLKLTFHIFPFNSNGVGLPYIEIIKISFYAYNVKRQLLGKLSNRNYSAFSGNPIIKTYGSRPRCSEWELNRGNMWGPMKCLVTNSNNNKYGFQRRSNSVMIIKYSQIEKYMTIVEDICKLCSIIMQNLCF